MLTVLQAAVETLMRRRLKRLVSAVTQVQSICEHIFSQLADTGTSDKVRAVLI